MHIINQAINNLTFDAKIRANAAVSALSHVDAMIEDFKLREGISRADILLDVFGLLQGLFVGIDAMYQLSFTTTKYKYHININMNKNLKQLKYLRNDVVGHPTNRNYEDGSFGFSIILNDEITRNELSYLTYIIKGKQIDSQKHTIDFKSILEAYSEEKDKFTRDLIAYLARNPRKTETSGLLVQLFEKALNDQYDFDLLTKIETLFLKEQNLYRDTRNRFVWRISLLRKLFVWNDEKYQAVIKYMTLQQILAIYQMNQDLNSSKIRIPNVELPQLLVDFDLMIKKHPASSDILNSLNDQDHPMFKNDVKELMDYAGATDVNRFIDWFLNLSDSDHKYLVGQVLKASLKRIVL